MRRILFAGLIAAAAFATSQTASACETLTECTLPQLVDELDKLNLNCHGSYNVCTTTADCKGDVNVCPSASSCSVHSTGVNVCPTATSCVGTVNVCN